MVNALRGQEALIMTLNVLSPMDPQLKLVDVAAGADVAHVVPNEYSPNFGGQPDFDKDALLGPDILIVRECIEPPSESSWIGLVCPFRYLYCLVTPIAYGFDIPNKIVTLFDDGERKITHSVLTQSLRAVAALFSLQIDGADACLKQWKNEEC